MELHYYTGEYYHGWMVRHSDMESCPKLSEISYYLDGVGQTTGSGVAQALGNLTEAEERAMHQDGAVLQYTADDVDRVAVMVAEWQARRAAKRASDPMQQPVRCACGHTVPRAQVMSASLGTSCPDCYDRMSD
jgi:hypothetical protein